MALTFSRMKSLLLLSFVFCSLCFVSCETVNKAPEPERERLSSIPHNMPESWEGQAGFPGQLGAAGASF